MAKTQTPGAVLKSPGERKNGVLATFYDFKGSLHVELETSVLSIPDLEKAWKRSLNINGEILLIVEAGQLLHGIRKSSCVSLPFDEFIGSTHSENFFMRLPR